MRRTISWRGWISTPTIKSGTFSRRNHAREFAPHVYRQTPQDVWTTLQEDLLALPAQVHGAKVEQLEPPLKDIMDGGALAQLEVAHTGKGKERYDETVALFVAD